MKTFNSPNRFCIFKCKPKSIVNNFLCKIFSLLILLCILVWSGCKESPEKIEARIWKTAEASNTLSKYKSYISLYPNNTHTSLAKEAIQKLIKDAPDETETRNKIEMVMLVMDHKFTRFIQDVPIHVDTTKPVLLINRSIMDLGKKQSKSLPPEQYEKIKSDISAAFPLELFRNRFPAIYTETLLYTLERDEDERHLEMSQLALLRSIAEGASNHLQVCYFVKMRQFVLTKIVTGIIDEYLMNTYLTEWKSALDKSWKKNNEEYITKYNSCVHSLENLRYSCSDLLKYNDYYREAINSLEGLAPLQMMRYDDQDARPEVKMDSISHQPTVPIFPLASIINLLAADTSTYEGLILMESIAKTKLAFIGLNAISGQGQYLKSKNLNILTDDLSKYLEFIDRKLLAPLKHQKLDSRSQEIIDRLKIYCEKYTGDARPDWSKMFMTLALYAQEAGMIMPDQDLH